MSNWKEREQQRFIDGTYKPVPVKLDYPKEHYVHLSTAKTEEDFIAYTPSEEYGKRDRQVRLKFGRYLRKAFESAEDSWIQEQVTALKAALAITEQLPKLHFATDRDTINAIFETCMCASGSTYESCMYGKFNGDIIRPYHVYADSPDVAVAYVLSGESITARSVVSTKDKEWVRLYSRKDGDNDTDCGVLEKLLTEAGYSKGDLYNNRLTNLGTDEVMLPYIDCGSCDVIESGKWWLVVKGTGDYTADCTDGTATENDERCSTCGQRTDDCECSYCECCEEWYQGGCDRCRFCEQCDSCTRHGGCTCNRCEECHELVEHCTCERCEECHELTGDCECTEEKPAEVTATITKTELTPEAARLKLNRAYIYLRDKNGATDMGPEFDLLKRAFDSIKLELELRSVTA